MEKIGPFHKSFGKDIEIHFWLPSDSSFSIHSRPYVKDVIELNIQGTKGYLVFDGYHRVENHPPPYPEYEGREWEKPHDAWLPQPLTMIVIQRVKNEDILFNICATKREIIECTDTYGKDVDPDGNIMNISLCSTDKQKLYFDIVRSEDKK